MAALYVQQGHYDDAESLYKRSLAIHEIRLGPDHPNVAIALANLAVLSHNQGRYVDAEPLFKRALAIFEKALGPNHPEVATAINNLAGFYSGHGRYIDSLPIVHRTIEQNFSDKKIAYLVLYQSARQHQLGAAEALSDSYQTVQRASSRSRNMRARWRARRDLEYEHLVDQIEAVIIYSRRQ